jgi:beta-lactam-binding protein with PASTA domain
MRRLLFTAAILAGLVVTAITYAAAGRQLAAVTSTAPATTTGGPPVVLVVPDVRREAFVFAKQQLQDAGFAWKVVGRVDGYAANTVVSQTPPPGTKLADTGAPLITVTLSHNRQYPSVGEPQNTSPYAPTPNRLAGSS